MKKFLKRFALLLLAVLVGLTIIFWTPDMDREEMVAKYTNSASGFVAAPDGTKVHYRDQGNKDGPVLLLLHGSGASLHTWEDMNRQLEDSYRLISLDLPGHGLTGPNTSRDYTAEGMMGSVTAVMDHLKIERAVVAGNSMGGWLTWRYALAHPSRVDGMILIDASGAVTDEKRNPYLAARIMSSKPGQLLALKIAPKSIIRSTLKEVIFDEAQITDALVTRYWEMARFPGNRQAMNDRSSIGRESEHWDRITDITVPILILWGEHDATIPVSHVAAFQEKFPAAKAVIYPNAAHLPMEELPLEVAADIREWHTLVFSGDTFQTGGVN